jgi:hypothetical protein
LPISTAPSFIIIIGGITQGISTAIGVPVWAADLARSQCGYASPCAV